MHVGKKQGGVLPEIEYRNARNQGREGGDKQNPRMILNAGEMLRTRATLAYHRKETRRVGLSKWKGER